MATTNNRNVLLPLFLFALVSLAGTFATIAHGGPLDPPAPPGSTDGVKLPGTPIATLPYTIGDSGAYYLTRNLTALSGNGITINADNVTLDLMGFALRGPVGGYGVYDGGAAWSNVVVRNGSLRNWNIAIYLEIAQRSSLDDLRVTNSGKGIVIGTGGRLSRLLVRANSVGLEILQTGLEYGTDLADSVISNNTVYGVVIEANNVAIHGNVIDANTLAGVRLTGSASWNNITDNRIVGNGYGIDISSSTANVNLVARNALLGNTSASLRDLGTGNLIGTFVGGDASITATNPWSNVVY